METQPTYNLEHSESLTTPDFVQNDNHIHGGSGIQYRQIVPMQEIVIWQNSKKDIEKELQIPEIQLPDPDECKRHEAAEKRPYEDTIHFLKSAYQHNAPQKALSKITSPNFKANFERGILVLENYFNNEKSTTTIATELNTTKTSIIQTKKRTLYRIWKNSPKKLREQYPFETLTLGRTKETIYEKLEKSLALRNQNFNKLIELLEEGRPIQSIVDELELTSRQLSDYRKRLRKWNIHVPHIAHSHILTSDINQLDLTEYEVRKMLQDTTLKSYLKNISGKNPTFIPIENIARNVGIDTNKVNSNLIADKLEYVGIPVGKVLEKKTIGDEETTNTHLFTLRKHIMIAKSALKADPDFDKYKIAPKVPFRT